MAREAKTDFDRTDWRLTFAVLLSPVIWFAHLNVSYSLVQSWCDSPSRWLLHVVTLAGLLSVASAGLLSWRSLQQFGREQTDYGHATETRRRFMALVGTAFAPFFALLILANEVANLMIRSCG